MACYHYSAIMCNTKQLVGKPCNLINELSCTGVASYSYFVGDSEHCLSVFGRFTSGDSNVIINDVIR